MTTLLSRRQELVQPPQFYLIDVHVTVATNKRDTCHERTLPMFSDKDFTENLSMFHII